MGLKRIQPFGGARPSGGGGRSRILYVEDDDPTWQLTERYLRDKYEIVRARTSQEALSLLSRQRYDLILLDIELARSDMDGIALCRLLRGKASPRVVNTALPAGAADVPIVFVTAYAARYPKEELLQAGANDVVTKPVDYTRLLLVSSRLLVSALHNS